MKQSSRAPAGAVSGTQKYQAFGEVERRAFGTDRSPEYAQGEAPTGLP